MTSPLHRRIILVLIASLAFAGTVRAEDAPLRLRPVVAFVQPPVESEYLSEPPSSVFHMEPPPGQTGFQPNLPFGTDGPVRPTRKSPASWTPPEDTDDALSEPYDPYSSYDDDYNSPAMVAEREWRRKHPVVSWMGWGNMDAHNPDLTDGYNFTIGASIPLSDNESIMAELAIYNGDGPGDTPGEFTSIGGEFYRSFGPTTSFIQPYFAGGCGMYITGYNGEDEETGETGYWGAVTMSFLGRAGVRIAIGPVVIEAYGKFVLGMLEYSVEDDEPEEVVYQDGSYYYYYYETEEELKKEEERERFAPDLMEIGGIATGITLGIRL